MRSRWLWIALSLGLIALVWGGWSWLGERRYRSELMEADREMASGLHQLARQRLDCAHQPTNRVGRSQLSTGFVRGNPRPLRHRRDCVIADSRRQLARLPSCPGSCPPVDEHRPVRTRRSTARCLFRANGGLRLSRPEMPCNSSITSKAGPVRSASSSTRAGPTLATRRVCSRSSIFSIIPRFRSTACGKTLENADPTDDRVWLGKANLAAWTGQFEQASRLLDQCTERRPHDELGLASPTRAGAFHRRSGNLQVGGQSSLARPVHARGSCSSFEPGWPRDREISRSSKAPSLH